MKFSESFTWDGLYQLKRCETQLMAPQQTNVATVGGQRRRIPNQQTTTSNLPTAIEQWAEKISAARVCFTVLRHFCRNLSITRVVFSVVVT
ncbi:hypothetical protein [Mesorhizobium sp. M0684]|uniref:hypothetical protein n=1 Tax=unclassified Mesorhizobium TaxID=325217 RepID=UPI00333A2867